VPTKLKDPASSKPAPTPREREPQLFMIRIPVASATSDPWSWCMGFSVGSEPHFGPLGCATFWRWHDHASDALEMARGKYPAAQLVCFTARGQ
jgi:hypothetical protein